MRKPDGQVETFMYVSIMESSLFSPIFVTKVKKCQVPCYFHKKSSICRLICLLCQVALFLVTAGGYKNEIFEA